MRKTILAVLLSGTMLPAVASAQMDGGAPGDGSFGAPTAVADDDTAGHTGSSNDPNGNMGNEGRTGKKDDVDAGADAAAGNNGAEGTSGTPGPNPQEPGVPSPYNHGKPPKYP